MVKYLDKLYLCEKTLSRLNEIACERDMTQREEKLNERTENKVREIANTMGFKVDFNADPRGCAIMFYLPSGKYNSWDGETWRINW